MVLVDDGFSRTLQCFKEPLILNRVLAFFCDLWRCKFKKLGSEVEDFKEDTHLNQTRDFTGSHGRISTYKGLAAAMAAATSYCDNSGFWLNLPCNLNCLFLWGRACSYINEY